MIHVINPFQNNGYGAKTFIVWVPLENCLCCQTIWPLVGILGEEAGVW
jgi:hypothetical protein